MFLVLRVNGGYEEVQKKREERHARGSSHEDMMRLGKMKVIWYE